MTLTVTQRKRLNSPHQAVGRWIKPKRRLAIYLRDGFECVLCGADLSNISAYDRTLDHHVPRASGGGNESTNLYTCCRTCNQPRVRTPWQLARCRRALKKPMEVALDVAAVLIAMQKVARRDAKLN